MNILQEICKQKINEINMLKNSINYKNKIVISERRNFLEKLIRKISQGKITMGPVPIINERPCYQGLLYYNDTQYKCPKLVQSRSLVGLIQRRNLKYI